VVCISTSSIYTKLNSVDARERELIHSIKDAEGQLSRVCRDRHLPMVLLHPAMIYGCGLDQNLSLVARLIRRFHFFPVAGRAGGLRQPVHAADLADLLLTLVQAPQLNGFSSPVGGGSILSYRQMVEKVFVAMGISPRILPVPPAMLMACTRLLGRLPGLRSLNPGFVLRQNLDQVFDDSVLKAQFEFSPRAFEPGPADFTVPEYAGRLQLPDSS
jgi:nucleoside-diphosphate-sugar epimerase